MITPNYDLFYEKFQTLPDHYQTIIFHLLQDMEHTINVSSKEILYKRGFLIAMKEHDLSINQLAEIVDIKQNGEVKGGVRESIASLIERGHKGSRSAYLDIVCEILEIDETFLIMNSEYIYEHTQDIKWCYETISSVNQVAVYNLMTCIDGFESLEFIINNINIDSCNIGIDG